MHSLEEVLKYMTTDFKYIIFMHFECGYLNNVLMDPLDVAGEQKSFVII